MDGAPQLGLVLRIPDQSAIHAVPHLLHDDGRGALQGVSHERVLSDGLHGQPDEGNAVLERWVAPGVGRPKLVEHVGGLRIVGDTGGGA